MISKSNFNKLDKSQLIKIITNLETKLKNRKLITIIATALTIIMTLIIIATYITPFFCGIHVVYGGEDLEVRPYNKQEGVWGIDFETTGFIPTKNIILHVKFHDSTAKINYDDMYFNIFPDVRKAENDNEFEYKWNSYLGEIVVSTSISNYVMTELANYTTVTISTDNGMLYKYPN